MGYSSITIPGFRGWKSNWQRAMPQLGVLLLAWALTVLPAGPLAPAAAAPKPKGVAGVLAAKDLDAKAIALIRARKNLSAQDLLTLFRRERSNETLALALGIYLEMGDPDPTEAAALVAACAGRNGLFDTSAVMAALHKKMPQIVEVYLPDGRGSTPHTRRLAAAVLAAHATAMTADPPRVVSEPADGRADGAAAGKRKRRGRGGRGSAPKPAAVATIAKLLQPLLDDRDDETVEMAILAAARVRVEQVSEAVEAVRARPGSAIAAARQLYLARIGRPLDTEVLHGVLGSRSSVPRRASRLSPLLSSFEIRAPAACYVCEAIGEAWAAAKPKADAPGKAAGKGKEPAAGDPDGKGGAAGAQAAGSGPDPAHLEMLHEALSHRDLRVQVDAARALGRVASPESAAPLVAAVEDCEWPVLVHVAWALGGIPEAAKPADGSSGSVDVLIARLEEETGRFRLDLTHALASIAGEQHARDAEGWSQWWEQAKAGFTPDRAATAAYRARKRVQDVEIAGTGWFYGLKIFSDRFVFVLDTSASMKGEKIESLKQNMEQTLGELKPHVRFNVIDFGGALRLWRRGGLITARQLAGQAMHELAYMELSLGTRSFDAMQAGMMLPGMDTVIFLSDGTPVAGQFDAWAKIFRAFAVFNRYRPVAIHTIAFQASGASAAGMRDLAAWNHGRTGNPDHQ